MRRVTTKYGPGEVLFAEGSEGVLSHRFCVRLDNVPEDLREMHDRYGGIYISDREFKEEAR